MEITHHKSTPKVSMGHGALSQLRELPEGRIALIVDAYFFKTEAYAALTGESLSGREYKLICTVASEPSFDSIDPYIDVIRDYGPRYILAVGGGSTIDTAKALWMFYELPGLGWADAVGKPLPAFPGKATLVAAPTTSGTGAEATGAGVYKSYDNMKALIISDEIRPGQAILDFSLLASIPQAVLAHSGVDALAHVVGALSCKACSKVDKLICDEVAVTLMKKLPRSLRGDMKARDDVHVCAFLAGDAINNAGGGLEHKLDQFAKEYHLPHGLVIGVFLPYTMMYLLDENHYADIADQLGLVGTDREKQVKLIDTLWSMYDAMGIPRTLKGAGVPEEDYLANIPRYIEQVKRIGHIYLIQGFKGDGTLRDLYLSAYYGMGR